MYLNWKLIFKLGYMAWKLSKSITYKNQYFHPFNSFSCILQYNMNIKEIINTQIDDFNY